MALVTLTTDLGIGSYSLASLKGAILSENQIDTQIIDVSSDIKAFNIVEGAFALSNAHGFFPEKSIHIIHINPFYSSNYKLLILQKNGHYFIAPNNGVLPLLFDNDIPDEIIYTDEFSTKKDLYYCYAVLINKISKEELNIDRKTQVYKRISLKPVKSKDSIRGTVIFIDHFGNIITNVSKEHFERVRNGRSLGVFFRHKDPITEIVQHYHQVGVGEELCRFNTTGMLEIAVNLGNANQNLGIQLDDIIQIDFY